MTTELLPYQRRVVAEKVENDERLLRLTTFIGTPAFNALRVCEQRRMLHQATTMSDLSMILGDRIASFEPTPP